jgi:hypothetical protein
LMLIFRWLRIEIFCVIHSIVIQKALQILRFSVVRRPLTKNS